MFRGTVIASDPSIVEDGDALRMSYTDLDPATERTAIAVATSRDDGRTWVPVEASRLAAVGGTAVAGEPGTWRENVEGSALVRAPDGRYLLYFSGYRDEGVPQKGFPAALGLATSSDGEHFEAMPEPVLSPTPGWYDNDAIYSPAIVRDGSGWFLAYAGHCYTDASGIERPGVYLLGARSADGVTWHKLPRPLLTFDDVPDFMKDGAAEPGLVRLPDGRWGLLFTGLEGEARAIGVATARTLDGPWRLRADPLMLPGTAGADDDHQVLAPTALVAGDRLKVWYLAASRRGGYAVGYREAPLDSLPAAP